MMHHEPLAAPLARQAARPPAGPPALAAQLPQTAAPAIALAADGNDAGGAGLVASEPADAGARLGHADARADRAGTDSRTGTAPSAMGTAGLPFLAAGHGIALDRWESDWLGARLFLAGIADERCASFGSVGGLA
jgi:hypothetical protein